MIFYYAPILFVSLALFVKEVKNRYVELFMLAFIVLYVVAVCGLRYNSDIDYIPYVDLYNETPPINELTFVDLMTLYGESGYLILSSLLRYFGANFFVITLIFSLGSMFCKAYVVFRLLRYPCLAISLYLCLSFITVEFIELRWSFSSSLIFLSVLYAINNSNLKSFALIVFAALFHYFSIIFIFILFCKKLKNINKLFVFVAISICISLFFKYGLLSFSFYYDTDIYVLKRLLRYFNDPESSIGFFSYSKIIMYCLIFKLLLKNPCLYRDKRFVDLVKISLSLLFFSLIASFVPLFFYRSMVLADFFCIVTFVYSVPRQQIVTGNILTYSLATLFCVWGYFDVGNYINSERITEYRSWLSIFFNN